MVKKTSAQGRGKTPADLQKKTTVWTGYSIRIQIKTGELALSGLSTKILIKK